MNLKNIKDAINPAYNLGAFLSYEQVFNRVPYPAMDKFLWNMAVENVFEGRRQIIKGWTILQEYKRLKVKETPVETPVETHTKELKPTQNQLNLFDAVDFDIQKVDDTTFNVVRDNKVIYTVTKNQTNYTCTCPAFKFRGKCKHIEEVMNLVASTAPKVEPKNKRHPRSEFEKFIPELTELCEPFDLWEAVGSFRREKQDFKDIDVIALGKSGWKQVHKNLEDSGAWEQIIYGDTLMRGMYHGYYLDFNLCPSEKNWVWWLLYRTGSANFNLEMRKRAIAMGYALSEQPLKDRFTFKEVDHDFNTEEDIFTFLGFEYLEPKYREPQNLRTLRGWKLDEHKSPGLKALESGDFDWEDYIISVIETAKSNATYTKQAKYPARLAIVIAREIARRTGKSESFILSFLDPYKIQPEGFKAGQQLWDKNGNIYRA